MKTIAHNAPTRVRLRAGQENGFTLMELMIAIVVVAILTSIAIPTYNQQIQKSRRTEAQIALVEMANLEEQFFSNNFHYSTTLSLLPYAATTDGGSGYYRLSVASPSGRSFTITATPVAGKAQADDTSCTTFTLTNLGVKGATKSGGADNTANCWAR